MVALPVLDYNDFTTLPLSAQVVGVHQLDFAPATEFETSSTAVFLSSQFDGTAILQNLILNGSAGWDSLDFNMDSGTLDLSLLQFMNWSPSNGGFGGDNVVVNGSAASDSITGSSQFNYLYGNDGDDTITANQADTVFAGNDDDTVIINGSPLYNVLVNGDIRGGDGIDTLIVNSSNALNDLTFSNPIGGFQEFEQFQLFTGFGNDQLSGSDLDDLLSSGGGNDGLNGGGGDDQLIGGSGRDNIFGGSGDDAINGGTEGDSISGGIGIDTILGGSGNDMMDGEDGDDDIDGGSGFDIIDGGIGNDTLKGGSYGDWIDGGAGNDVITGGTGRDVLGGGGGVDKFQYNLLGERGDIIEDFNSNDFMVFDASNFGLGSYVGTATATQFVAKTSGHVASTTTQRFIYDKTDDSLWYDSNGSATGGTIVKIADFNTTYDLNAGDILFIA